MSRWSIYRVPGRLWAVLTIILLSAIIVFVRAVPAPASAQPPDDLLAALERARTFSGGNDAWEPFVWEFDGLPMALVPPGCFPMGSDLHPGTSPIHRVCFDEPFWIGLTEVTNVQSGVSRIAAHPDWPRQPVTWHEAQVICQMHHARLPTEAEWEYAARGPDGWVYPWGDVLVRDYALSADDSNAGIAVVGSRPAGASWVGALDMSGNVWEWVADWYSEFYYPRLDDGAVNPPGPVSGTERVLRSSPDVAGLNLLRSSFRLPMPPDQRSNDVGLRCARSLSASGPPLP